MDLWTPLSYTEPKHIPIITALRPNTSGRVPTSRRRVLRRVTLSQRNDNTACQTVTSPSCQDELTPLLYVLNAVALSKPHAVQHLTADLHSNDIDIAVITETHFEQKHSDNIIAVPDYTVFRRDRVGRRVGGVAIYVRSTLQSSVWVHSSIYPYPYIRIFRRRNV